MNRLYSTFNGFAKTKRAWGIFYFLSEYARTFKRAINPACIQRSEYMKCRRLKALTFRIENKGRLSGITAKTALNRLYFIYCVSHRFIMTQHEIEREQRNLDPHRPARCAMWLYADRYASQKGGSMDFWDKLSERDKATCRRMAEQIVTTRPETETELNGG